MKILLLDIETSPNTAFVWGLFKENIPLARLIESSGILCWAAKWLGSKEILFDSVHQSSHRQMLTRIHKLLNEADAVVHYYGSAFDIPVLNREFIVRGFLPPAPYKQIDLCKVARSKFKFVSNKMEYVAKILNVKHKVDHRGFQMWVKCMEGDPEAWKEMKVYNIGDVETLEGIYHKMLPWIGNHPNVGVYDDSPAACPNCGGSNFTRRGTAIAQLLKYHRFQCKGCGKWVRGTKTISEKGVEKLVGLN